MVPDTAGTVFVAPMDHEAGTSRPVSHRPVGVQVSGQIEVWRCRFAHHA
jgi:hypothetical protein